LRAGKPGFRSRVTIAGGGLELDQAKRMKELERENVRLKRLVADLSLEKQVLKDVASGNLFSIRGA
jgi:putative transposase